MAQLDARKPHHQGYAAQTPQLIPRDPVTFVKVYSMRKTIDENMKRVHGLVINII